MGGGEVVFRVLKCGWEKVQAFSSKGSVRAALSQPEAAAVPHTDERVLYSAEPFRIQIDTRV